MDHTDFREIRENKGVAGPKGQPLEAIQTFEGSNRMRHRPNEPDLLKRVDRGETSWPSDRRIGKAG